VRTECKVYSVKNTLFTSMLKDFSQGYSLKQYHW